MSDLNTLFEAFKAFIMVQVKVALESALEGVDSRLERLEESLDGRDVIREIDRLDEETSEHENRLEGLSDLVGGMYARLSVLERDLRRETEAGPERFTAMLRNTLFTVDGGPPVLGGAILDDNEDDQGGAFDALVKAWEGGTGQAPLGGPWGAEVRVWGGKVATPEPEPAPNPPRFNVATFALWRACLCALEVHFKGDDSDASRAFAMLSKCLLEIMKDD